MYKLYYSPGACSLAVHVVLLELNAKFELENVKAEQGKTKLLEVNSRGMVPVLKIDNFVLREGAAILLYLLENNQSNLLAKSGLERAKQLEWLAFANASLHPAYGKIFGMMKSLGDQASKNPLYKVAIEQIQKHWNEIEQHLVANEYLVGNKISVADILVTVIANWSGYFGGGINYGERTKAYFSKVISRDAFKKALNDEGVEYKANL